MNKIDKNYDVIVVGLGTAGAIALIYAAKLGLKVLGIERLNAMGGMGTTGNLPSYYFGSAGGFYEEINQQVSRFQEDIFPAAHFQGFSAKAYVLEKNAAEYGADFLYETIVTKVFVEEKRVTGLQYYTDGEYNDVQARFIIDCTGEGDICVMAGCKTNLGRTFDGQTQPFSNLLTKFDKGLVTCIAMDNGYVRQQCGADLSNAILQSLTIPSFLKDDYTDFPVFATNASLLGLREGRLVEGEETLTLQDYFDEKHTDKPLFYAYSNVDNHGKDTAFESETLKDWYVCAGLWGVNFSVGVPMGALIPKGFENLLVAGRCLSVDHDMAPCVRMMRDMEKSGEAAAAIAFFALQNGTSAKDVDYPALERLLQKTGCLDHANHVGLINRVKKGTKSELLPFSWLSDSDQIKDVLASDAPGIGIWSAKRMGDKIKPDLVRWVNEKSNPKLQKHSSIALGLLGGKEALSMLRQMAQERDLTIPNSGVKYVYTLGTSAIYLLGKLGDTQSIDLLGEIVSSGGSFDESRFVPDELYGRCDDVKFQFLSYAIDALLNIRMLSPQYAEKIDSLLDLSIMQRNKPLEITLKSNVHIKYDMMPKIKEYITGKKCTSSL